MCSTMPRAAPSAAFLLLAFCPLNGAAAPRTAKFSPQYVHTAWGTNEGLPQNSITASLQSRLGYLWLGTFGGLARFDGINFTVLDMAATPGLSSNRILSLYEDEAGNLWIGTEHGGLSRYSTGKATTYTTRDGLPSESVNSIRGDRQGHLWANTEKGSAIFSGGRFVPYTQHQGVPVGEFLHQGRDGSLWFLAPQGVVRFHEKQMLTYKLRERPLQYAHFSFHETPEGSVWIATYDGLVRFQNESFTTFLSYPNRSPDYPARVVAIGSAPDGATWFMTREGLFQFTGDRTIDLRRIPEFQQLTGRPMMFRTFIIDREGSIWIGTDGKGLHRFKEAQVTAYGKDEGLSDGGFQSIFEDRDGAVWMCGEHVYRLRDGHFTPVPQLEDIWSASQDREGNFWFGSYGGLARLHAGQIKRYGPESFGGSIPVASLFESQDGTLWAGLAGEAGGIFRFQDGKWEQEKGLAFHDARFITQDRHGTLWIGSTEGLARFRGGVWSHYTTKDGLSASYVRAIYEDAEGTLWIGTYGGGLNRFRDGKFTAITARDGLFDNVVSRILEDDRGNLWMSSNRGIYRASREELNSFADGKLRTITSVSYGMADGMKTTECNGGGQPAGWKTRDGKMWFPTIMGVAVIDPNRINRLPAPVLIEKILIDKSNFTASSAPEVPPGSGEIELHYSGLSLLAPEKVRFRYKLEGFDAEWVEAGGRRVAYYTNIPAGQYTFRVTAANNDGVWNDRGASFTFSLKPRFYRTPAFLGICALAAVFSGTGLYRLRIRHVRIREQELARLVERRTIQLREEVQERTRTEEQLRAARNELEQRVRERTAELAQTNQALRAEEIRYRDLFENAHDIIYTHDLSGNFTSLNNLALALTGYSREEALRMNLFQLVAPEYRERTRQILNRGLAGQLSNTYDELEIIGKDGRRLSLELSVRLICADGQPLGMQGIARDVTQRKRLEEQLRRERRLFISGPVTVFRWAAGTQGRVEYVSPNLESLFGYSVEDFLSGRLVYEQVIHPEDLERVRNELEEASAKGWTNLEQHYRIVRRDGEVRWLDDFTVIARNERGRVTHYEGYVLDVTQRKNAERTLQESEERYRLLFHRSPVGIVHYDPKLRVTDVNDRFLQTLKATRDRAIGLDLCSLKDERLLPCLRSALEGKEGFYEGPYETTLSDLVLSIAMHTVPLRDEGGEIRGGIGIIEDITDRKRLEEDLRQAQKMEAMGRLAGGVADDFNNLLEVIIGSMDLALERLSPSAPLWRYVEQIQKAAFRAADLTRQLLAFSRKQVLEPRILDLNAVVAEVEKLLRRVIGEHIDLVTLRAPSLGHVRADPGQIEQVLLNLAVNARDAMPAGGKLKIETANVELDESHHESGRDGASGPHVLLSVTDTGKGMDPATQSRIFEPFFTTKGIGKGTGLGLATVYGIVKQSGGHIDVQTELGRGTSFMIYLPRVSEAVREPEPPAASAKSPRGSETVLVVEDEQAVRAVICEALRHRGYRVIEASNAQEALEWSAKEPRSIHVLVTDMVMPGMGGRDLAKQLTKSRPDAKVLYLSGYTDSFVIEDSLGPGAGFLQKPFSLDALTRKLRELLDTPSG